VRAVTGSRTEKAEGLYRSHARRLFDFALRRTGDEHAADDVVNETLAVALEKDAPPGNEGPWLFRIARNKLWRLAEKRARRRERVLDAAAGEPSTAPAADDAVQTSEERARVGRALSSLEPDLAQVVRLMYVERRSHAEIAERLGVPATTVQSRLRSALRELHRALIEGNTR
jgi:RNA polymerase sigma-70 factor (ECF subfamily)